MNIVILGDKYDKGKKSKGCQALIDYNTTTKYIDYQYKVLKENTGHVNVIYVYGLGDKKFISYYYSNKSLRKIKTIFNNHYETKNETYSIYLCKDVINVNDPLLILYGNSTIKKQHLNKLLNKKETCIFHQNKGQTEIGCIHNNKNVENIGLDLELKIDNIYYISQPDMVSFMEIISDSTNHNRFVFEIINLMIDQNILVELL